MFFLNEFIGARRETVSVIQKASWIQGRFRPKLGSDPAVRA